MLGEGGATRFYRSYEATQFAAAQMWQDSARDVPVVTFSWPTAENLDDYFASMDSAQHSVDQLIRFLKVLYAAGAREIHVCGHSMAARIVLPARPSLCCSTTAARF